MLNQLDISVTDASGSSIHHSSSAPPSTIPPGYVGPFFLPDTGRMVWWTGRVAIGLLHQPQRRSEMLTQASEWAQNLFIHRGRPIAG